MRVILFPFLGLLLLPLFMALGHLSYSGWNPPTTAALSENDVRLLKVQQALWVDAREESLFQKAHVPGAVNLNRKNWEQSLPALFEHYEEGRTIIVYCSVGCNESHVIAAKIRELGLEDVQVFEGGYEAWRVSRPSKAGELRRDGEGLKANSNFESRNPKQIPNLKSNETK